MSVWQKAKSFGERGTFHETMGVHDAYKEMFTS